jgi:hypothetical protein
MFHDIQTACKYLTRDLSRPKVYDKTFQDLWKDKTFQDKKGRQPFKTFRIIYIYIYIYLKNSLIIHEENTEKNHKRVVSVYVIQIHVDLHKL